MSRYSINFDRLVNVMVPDYLRNRKYVLFLQSLVYPLQASNEKFLRYTEMKKLEASMTSQVILFKWYLNKLYGKYLVNSEDSIEIIDAVDVGVPIYRQNDPNMKPCTFWFLTDNWESVKGTDEEPKKFYHRHENVSVNKASFTVSVPQITIPQEEFVTMISSTVNQYKIAGKTFIIKITDNQNKKS